MRNSSVLSFMAAALLLASCGSSATRSAAGVDVPAEVNAAGITFNMVEVPGGTFAMGQTPTGVKVTGASIHQVVLKGFSISQLPVTAELWQAVVGDNPSTADSQAAPVDRASYDDCVKFVAKLSKLTGIPFSLPTEAQWEYALREGLVKVNPNYREWCADAYEDSYGDSLMIDPQGPKPSTDLRIVRDAKTRDGLAKYTKNPGVSLRVVANTDTPTPADVIAAIIDRKTERESKDSGETVKAGNVSFRMIGVKGGSFEMGATPEQGNMAGEDEHPVHKVKVSGFEIGETEVTVGLWQEVMGGLPYRNNAEEADKPVVNVSWYDCQMFILKLNKLTGRHFRLPTEAEWEFAARGGNLSRHYMFAGSEYCSLVAAYIKNASSDVVKVKSFQPNELGIYDMSGNAWEWCQDNFAKYTAEDQVDPCAILPGETFVMRGGSAASKWDACRVANRSKLPGSSLKATFGFRLAL